MHGANMKIMLQYYGVFSRTSSFKRWQHHSNRPIRKI